LLRGKTKPILDGGSSNFWKRIMRFILGTLRGSTQGDREI